MYRTAAKRIKFDCFAPACRSIAELAVQDVSPAQKASMVTILATVEPVFQEAGDVAR